MCAATFNALRWPPIHESIHESKVLPLRAQTTGRDFNAHLEPGAEEGCAKAEGGIDGHLGSEPRLVVDRGGEGPAELTLF